MIYYLGLGSNLGNRLANLQLAVNVLDLRAGKVVGVSKVYESAPMYVINQPPFLNAVAKLESSLDPAKLLVLTKTIEKECGRIARERNGPSELDIDLLLAIDQGACLKSPPDSELRLPHPAMCERRFVLEPLADLDPGLICCDGLSVAQILRSDTIQSQKSQVFEHGVLSIHRD